MLKNNKLIVIEGLDGSGKATQTINLTKKLKSMNIDCKDIHFPCYDSDSSALVKMYLNGTFGDNPDDVNAYAASAFYAVDRIASYLQDWKKDYENGSVILSDRYSSSNILYQLQKIPPKKHEQFINWCIDFEHNKLGIPYPDLTIYLDVPVEISQKLMEKRYKGDNSKKDIHEKNIDMLQSCRNSALYCADKLNWHMIDCSENGELLSIKAIGDKIWNIVSEFIIK